ncbi:MAG: MFS transporter [Pirellulales bacterium]
MSRSGQAASAPAFGRASQVRWRIVALLMAFSFMNYVNRVSMSVAGDEIRGTYGLSETELGTVISALIAAYMLCMVPGGWLSDRLGASRALTLMGFGSAAFCALTGVLVLAVAPSQTAAMLGMLWLVRALMGAFTAPLYPAAGRAVSRWIPFGQRARVNALVTGVAMIGIACTYPLFGLLLEQFGLAGAFLMTGLVTAGLAVLWAGYARDEPGQHPRVNEGELWLISGGTDAPAATFASEPPPVERGRQAAAWGGLLRNRSLWLLTASYAAVGYVEYLVFYWSEYYFKNVLHFSELGGRIAAMIPPVCMGLCMPLGGWLSDRLMSVVGYRGCRAAVAMFGMVACSIMLTSATVVTNDVAIVACFALSLAFIGLTEAPAWATAIDLGGKRAGTSAAIANTGGNTGGALSPTITPWVSGLLVAEGLNQQQGWAWGMRLASLICLVGAILWFWIDASERHETAPPGATA